MSYVKNASIMKKGFVGIVLCSALGVSASAACSKAVCVHGDVGVGGLEVDFGGDRNASVKSRGGYGKFGLKMLIVQRVQLGLAVRIGGGVSKLSGATLAGLATDDTFGLFGGDAKLGVNIAGLNAPVFLNLVFDVDAYVNRESISRSLGILGLEIEGRVPVSETTHFTYSGGAGIADGLYKFHTTGDKTSNIKDGSYAIFGSIGITKNIGENVSFYFKGVGKYYNLGASSGNTLNFPIANAWQAGAEAGISF